jgi:F-type H+-transporting ATPase subunit gamma
MSRRRDIETHRRSLDEISEIMNSMKNLSYMETRKISTFLDVQHAMVRHIETVAADFLGHYPETLMQSTNLADSANIYLLIGAERGFCGDFNHTLRRHLETTCKINDADNLQIICVGHKMGSLLENYEGEILFIDGASVAEEVDTVLNRIVSELAEIQKHSDMLRLYVLYHGEEQGILHQQLLPPFNDLRNNISPHGQPPLLNQAPEKFLLELGYQYLLIVLYEILHTSLMAECHHRVSHLEGAIQHLDDESADLQRQINSLRQEEIIEEIEVILLSQPGES